MTNTLRGVPKAAAAAVAAALVWPARTRGLGSRAGCTKGLGWGGVVGGLVGAARPGYSATLPTSLPTGTTSLSYGNAGYSGTIPTQFGLLTNMVGPASLHENGLTGVVPTQLGLWTRMTSFMVG